MSYIKDVFPSLIPETPKFRRIDRISCFRARALFSIREIFKESGFFLKMEGQGHLGGPVG